MIEPETIVVEQKRRDFWTHKEEKKRVSNTMNVILALANKQGQQAIFTILQCKYL